MPNKNRQGAAEAKVEKEDDIKKSSGERSKDAEQWMGGRAVYRRPESRSSTMAQRDIVRTEEDMGKLALAFIENMKEHHGRTDADVEREIAELDEYEATFRGADEK